MIPWISAHWEVIAVIGILGLTGVLVFRNTLAVYDHIFFTGRALRNSLIKTVLMVALLFLIYAVPYWLFRTLLPDGWVQVLALLLSFVLFDIVWDEAGHLLDRIIVGR